MKFSLLLTAICLSACGFTTKNLGAATAQHAEKIVWMTDFEKAKELARIEKKPLFVDFSGSDWCPHCKNLDREILSTPEFQKQFGDRVIFVLVDFPRHKPIDPQLKKQNEELSKKYKVRGFPTVLIFDSEMNQIGQMGYMSGGPGPFSKKLEDIISK